jgi:hypothetical protein
MAAENNTQQLLLRIAEALDRLAPRTDARNDIDAADALSGTRTAPGWSRYSR